MKENLSVFRRRNHTHLIKLRCLLQRTFLLGNVSIQLTIWCILDCSLFCSPRHSTIATGTNTSYTRFRERSPFSLAHYPSGSLPPNMCILYSLNGSLVSICLVKPREIQLEWNCNVLHAIPRPIWCEIKRHTQTGPVSKIGLYKLRICEQRISRMQALIKPSWLIKIDSECEVRVSINSTI